jgi:hypothetical protein
MIALEYLLQHRPKSLDLFTTPCKLVPGFRQRLLIILVYVQNLLDRGKNSDSFEATIQILNIWIKIKISSQPPQLLLRGLERLQTKLP